MSFSACILANIGTAGLTLKAALTTTSPLVPHVTVRDLAVGEIGQGFYELRTTAIPYGALGSIMFYTGSLGVATVWTGVVIKAGEDIPFLTTLASLKDVMVDSASVSSDTITTALGATITKSGGNRVFTAP